MELLQMLADLVRAYPGLTVAVVAVTLYLVLGGATARARAREYLYALMLRAEKAAARGEFGPVTGEELKEIVIQQFLTAVRPGLVRRFPFLGPIITEAWVRQVFDWLYERARDYLDDGRFNSSAVDQARRSITAWPSSHV